MTVEFLSS